MHHFPECICRNSGVRARCASRQSEFDLQCVFWSEDAICISRQSVSAGILECGRAAPVARVSFLFAVCILIGITVGRFSV